ncbi:MAG: hypothetical protein KDB00_10645 [Planctomycetales bacterium]|nr:hypothetical protein [Planctomycetales bacterium]
MKMTGFAVFALMLALFSPASTVADTVDGRVFQVQLPREDVTLFYVEARSGFTVKMETETAAVEGQKLYVGDGKVAIDLVAHSTQGIYLQGVKYRQGDQFKNGATIKVLAGFKQAAELKPGDVYVTLPGVAFELPKK